MAITLKRSAFFFILVVVSASGFAFFTHAAWVDAPASAPSYGTSPCTYPCEQADFQPVNLGTASQTKNGSFGANQFCLGGSCITAWPSGATGYWTLSGSDMLRTNDIAYNVHIGTSVNSSANKLTVVQTGDGYAAVSGTSVGDGGTGVVGAYTASGGAGSGVRAIAQQASGYGIHASNSMSGVAGWFEGNVVVDAPPTPTGARIKVNNPYTALKNGSSGDAIYAYANSANAAVSAEQGDASGYAIYASGGTNYFSGNVGIGANPSAKLHVEGAGATVRVQTTDTANPGVNLHNSAGTLKASFGYLVGSDVAFLGYAGNNHLNINSAGVVQIPGALQKYDGITSTYQNVCLENGKDCPPTGGTGTVTQVNTGNGLAGGPITTTGIISADTNYLQRRVSGSCVAGESIRVINSDGTVTCEPDDTGAVGTVTGTGSSGRMSFWNGVNSLSSNVNFVWDDTNIRLGIGATAPSTKLEVQGTGSDTDVRVTGPDPRVSLNSNTAGTGRLWYLQTQGFNGSFRIYDDTANQERLTMLPSGYTGLGMSAPGHMFHIATSSGETVLGLQNQSANGRLWQLYSTGTANGEGAGKFMIRDNNAASNNVRMLIDTSGNVGIGTTNPSATTGVRLDVQGGAIKATGGLIVETRTSEPTTPADGQIWLRTDL